MKKLVRLTSALLAVALLSVLCAVPAAAGEMTGKASYTVGYIYDPGYANEWRLLSSGYVLNYSSMSVQSHNFTWNYTAGTPVTFGSLDMDDDGIYYTGAVGVYFSYYYAVDFQSLVSTPGRPSTRWKNHMGHDGSGDHDVKVVTFTPAGSTPGSGVSYGYSLSAEYLGSDDAPITDLRIVGDASCVVGNMAANSMREFYFRVPSFRVVGVETSAELSELENIADSIVAQNGILNAMYGDIMAILNAIHDQTGDILETQRLANTYLSAIASTLSTLSNTTSSIYSLLSAQFSALISAINTASTDLQAAISAQTAAIIAYLESLQNVTEVPPAIKDQTTQGDQVRQDMAGLQKPDMSAPDVTDFFSPEDAQPFNDVLGQIFGSNLIVTLLLIAFSMAFVGYVLYGKR